MEPLSLEPFSPQPPSVVHQLESSSKPLRFLLNGEQLVPSDFHVTEIKRVAVTSLDCGGGASAWQELVIQLWSPTGEDAQTAMTAAKFLSILARAGATTLLETETVRFEYGGADRPAVQYYLDRIDLAGGTADVHLASPRVACKPRERDRLAEVTVGQNDICCAPRSTGACCS